MGSAGRSIGGDSETGAAITGASAPVASTVGISEVVSAETPISGSARATTSFFDSDVSSVGTGGRSDALSRAATASGTAPPLSGLSASGFAAARGRGDRRRGVGVDTGANSTVSSTVNRVPSMSTQLDLQMRT